MKMRNNNTLKHMIDNHRVIKLNQISNQCRFTVFSGGMCKFRRFSVDDCAREQRIDILEKMYNGRVFPLWLIRKRKNTINDMSFFIYKRRSIKHYGNDKF